MNNKISTLVAQHELFLQQLLSSCEIPAQGLREAINYSLFSGGKRLRPILVYLCGELVQVPVPCLDIIAAAIELTHCYSLVHDDLPAMDNDDLRRGKPSCHKAFDEATAILAGDALQALAIDILLGKLPDLLPASQVIAVSKELIYASGPAGMVSGQSLDLSELCKTKVSEEQLRTIHLLKTGKLFSACINMVLAASDASDTARSHLGNYASRLGLAFQMQDDYLDEYAPQAASGKGRASDRSNQKTTFARLYDQSGLLEQINHYFQEAKNELIPFKHQAGGLLDFTETLQNRSFAGSPA